MAYESNGSAWNQIQLGVREAKQLLDRGEYNLCMVKARQTLEVMVGYLAAQSGIQSGDLVDAIDQLTEIRLISRVSGEHYHAIRMLGNKAVHENYWDSNEAQRAYRLLLEEVRTFGNDYLTQTSRGAAAYTRPAAGSVVDLPIKRADSHRETSRESRREPDPETRSRRSSHTESTGRVTPSRTKSNPSRSSSANHSRRRPAGSKKRRQGISPIQLIKIGIGLIFLLLLVLLAVYLVKGFNSDKKNAPQTTPSNTEETVPTTTTQAPTLPTQTEPTTVETTESPQTQTYKVNADSLNMRSEASQSAGIRVQIPKGAEVEFVREHDESWSVVRYNGTEGYVSSQFISPVNTGTGAAQGTSAPAATTTAQ